MRRKLRGRPERSPTAYYAGSARVLSASICDYRPVSNACHNRFISIVDGTLVA